ncbi:MAG TPA: alpha/beta fold hydrolase [Actinopolymorphaceae bacterium]
MSIERTLEIPAAGVTLEADVALPSEPRGMVLFAHGSGSSRRSPRNRYVASELQEEGFGTILVDLLTPAEGSVDDRTAELRFDIGFLAVRLTAIAEWSIAHYGDLRLGLFGASTGAAAALVTAAHRPAIVSAVVSRGGRPDLAGPALHQVVAPTLLVVGGRDHTVLELNQAALRELPVEPEHKELVVVPGATHLFEEPGALEQVAQLAAGWFGRHVAATD